MPLTTQAPMREPKRPTLSDMMPQAAAPMKKPEKKAELERSRSQEVSQKRPKSLRTDSRGCVQRQESGGRAQKASVGSSWENADVQAESRESTHSQRCSLMGSLPGAGFAVGAGCWGKPWQRVDQMLACEHPRRRRVISHHPN